MIEEGSLKRIQQEPLSHPWELVSLVVGVWDCVTNDKIHFKNYWRVSSSSAGTIFVWLTNASRLSGSSRWGGLWQSLIYLYISTVFQREFIKMDERTDTRQATSVHITLPGLLQNPASQKQVGALENALEVYLWQKLLLWVERTTRIWWKRYKERAPYSKSTLLVD